MDDSTEYQSSNPNHPDRVRIREAERINNERTYQDNERTIAHLREQFAAGNTYRIYMDGTDFGYPQQGIYTITDWRVGDRQQQEAKLVAADGREYWVNLFGPILLWLLAQTGHLQSRNNPPDRWGRADMDRVDPRFNPPA